MAFCTGCGSTVDEGTRFCQKCGQPVASAAPVPSSVPATYAAQPVTTGTMYAGPVAPVAVVRYGGFWLRVLATIIDGFVLAIPFWVVFAVVIAVMGGTAAMFARIPQNPDPNEVLANVPAFISALLGFILIIVVIGTTIHWLYYALMESSSKQGTLGKMALSMAVTDMNFQRITFGRASARYFTKFGMGLVPLGFIGYILAGFTEKKQALEDFVANTLVIRKG
jgi:uncharacterized RDD family membrane protein YckC